MTLESFKTKIITEYYVSNLDIFINLLEKKRKTTSIQMNNTNSNSSIVSQPLPIDVLLSYAGFLPFESITYVFVIPLVGFLGALLCLLSVLIFFRASSPGKEFKNEPVYVYFKTISIINLVQLLAFIPNGFCFTPSAIYLPQIDMQKCIIFQLVYGPFSNLFFHYTGVLEIIIVLDRMKVNFFYFSLAGIFNDCTIFVLILEGVGV